MTSLSREAGHGRPAAPVRLVHLGLGNFFRAHQAWYTEHAPDAPDWGIAAFSGRRAELADALDRPGRPLHAHHPRRRRGSLRRDRAASRAAHPAANHDGWLRYLASPDVRAVTLTVTEAGYLLGRRRRARPRPARGPRRHRGATERPRRSCAHHAGATARRARGAPARGCRPADDGAVRQPAAQRRRADRVLHDVAGLVDPGLEGWMRESVATVTTMVDRITPGPRPRTCAPWPMPPRSPTRAPSSPSRSANG